ncbi:MAG: hypothetical protein KBC81_01325 [Candidatus Pacebacteria bacterium]|nr:hypothetical protein [Candidatus Paceibacterota bacterium]
MKRLIEFAILGFILIAISLLATHIPYSDKVCHVIGGIAVAWLFEPLFSKNYSSKKSLGFWLAIIGVVSTVGIAWEIAEHLSSVYSPVYLPKFLKYFYGGDLSDTLRDLVADISGSLIYLFYRSR